MNCVTSEMEDLMLKNASRSEGALLIGAAALASAACIAVATAVLSPQPAQALPKYARRTGLACGRCHVNPEGGGARNAFGRAFAANGHHLPGKVGKHARSNSGTNNNGRHYHDGMMGGHHHGMMGHHHGMMMGHGMMNGY
jgi:hypothetical protein